MIVIPKVKIQILCKCPSCEFDIDLMKKPYLNDLLWNFFEHWIHYKKTHALDFQCENCAQTFYVQDMVMRNG